MGNLALLVLGIGPLWFVIAWVLAAVFESKAAASPDDPLASFLVLYGVMLPPVLAGGVLHAAALLAVAHLAPRLNRRWLAVASTPLIPIGISAVWVTPFALFFHSGFAVATVVALAAYGLLLKLPVPG